MIFWSSPEQQRQAGLRYLNSLLLAGQRQGLRTGLRDCQPLPCSALGTRHQTSRNSAVFASTPLNVTSLAGEGPGRVSKGAACAGTFSTHSLPGNYREYKILQAIRQHAVLQGKAVPAGPGGGTGREPPIHTHTQGIPAVPSEERGISHHSDPAHIFLRKLRSWPLGTQFSAT